MKRYIAAFLFLVLAAACENPLEYRPKDTSKKLIMNSLLEVGADTHVVYLGISTVNGIEAVKSGEVKCYVNGKLAAVATHADAHEWPKQESAYYTFMEPYLFTAGFAAGDEIIMEAVADGGSYKASASVTVPPMPELKNVSVLEVKEPMEDWVKTVYKFSITLQDNDPGHNYYRLLVNYDYHAAGFAGGQCTGESDGRIFCSLDTSGDPVLSESSFSGPQAQDALFSFDTPNRYGIFTDLSFNGKSITLRPSADQVSFWDLTGDFGYGTDVIEVEGRFCVEISLLSEQYYYYLKSLNSLFGDSAIFALEDITLPDNIDGGIGFVGMTNPERRILELPVSKLEPTY